MAMAVLLPPKDRRDFDVAIICALQLEADAAEALFDHFWDDAGDQYGKAPGDQNTYRTGVIGNHNVVLAYMPGIGKGYAASVAASFRSSFQGIRLALLVGICGGVPGGTEKGIFLGDIVISDEIVIYDLGRRLPGGFYRKEALTNSPVNLEIRAFLHKLKGQKGREHLLNQTHRHLTTLQDRTGDYRCPARRLDRLFKPTYHHKHHNAARCWKCKKNELCKQAQETLCEELKCDTRRLVVRSRPSPNGIDIHFGRIASGDTVMKSGVDRDKIAAEENVIAFEMEGAGICNNLPCIVVKGVCDYADSHNDKVWQKYTAGTAAASIDRNERRDEQPTDTLRTGSCCHLDTTLSQAASSQSTYQDEGYNSQKNYDIGDGDLSRVLPTIDRNFKAALTGFRKHRKYLPRDVDLKSTLKTQRVIFSSNVEIMPSSGPLNHSPDLSSKVLLEVTIAIRTKLEEIEDATRRLPVATKAKVQPRSVADTLKDTVEDLISLVQVFTSLTPQPKQSRLSKESKVARNPGCRREFQHFRIVQQVACNLYDVLGTACNAHTVHDVHISLRPDLDGTLTRARFNVAFVRNPMAPGEAVWIDVESTIKTFEPSPQTVLTSVSRGPSSLKRPRQLQEAQACSKRVQFQLLPTLLSEPLQSRCPEEPITGIPNLYLQRNFCTVVERSLQQRECNDCIGLLGGNQIYQHLAYMGNQTNQTTMSMSLSKLITLSGADPTKGMGLYECVRLARYLATAVLYYHATPWLRKAWRSDDVQFFGAPDSLLQQPQNILPYMSTSIRASNSSMQSQSQPSEYQHIIRNPVLFGLGVMLLELAYQAPLRNLQQPVDLMKGETPGFADYFTAHRLVDYSCRKVSKSFRMIIKKCLHCDFGHDSDFTSPALQEAFFHDVIGGLENLEKVFQELQPDDP
ncbi:purine and uridine phosphorylase [Aspergillus sclerotioniger CBS 115572]|uniref:Purine and uridine phosphorylase n=1 Tax=Aspergillus sclerotioniger CBS 115572 TaxID=1450535 RepID=A0A317VYT5_9EURO|nr:purine and uridine phosphorylase [Aspergillus sclerotioniger CBS 115572]PWY78491.1 purine and uridine phosphorylase [Aspergillus sclerotioniger CBS 115572]